MTAIVCVDEAWGMAFHGRRQSRDRAVCARILEDAAAKFHGYDMTTQPESGYYVVLFEIDRFRAFCKAYNMDERNRILGKITEIIEEVFAESICCDVGAITENQIAVLCNVSEKTDIMRFSGNLNAG